MLCLSGFELYSHWVPLLCIRGGRGKSGRKGRRQEKLSNNAKYSAIQEGLKGENQEKRGGSQEYMQSMGGKRFVPYIPTHRDSTEEDHRILRRDVYVLLLNS